MAENTENTILEIIDALKELLLEELENQKNVSVPNLTKTDIERVFDRVTDTLFKNVESTNEEEPNDSFYPNISEGTIFLRKKFKLVEIFDMKVSEGDGDDNEVFSIKPETYDTINLNLPNGEYLVRTFDFENKVSLIIPH